MLTSHIVATLVCQYAGVKRVGTDNVKTYRWCRLEAGEQKTDATAVTLRNQRDKVSPVFFAQTTHLGTERSLAKRHIEEISGLAARRCIVNLTGMNEIEGGVYLAVTKGLV